MSGPRDSRLRTSAYSRFGRSLRFGIDSRIVGQKLGQARSLQRGVFGVFQPLQKCRSTASSAVPPRGMKGAELSERKLGVVRSAGVLFEAALRGFEVLD